MGLTQYFAHPAVRRIVRDVFSTLLMIGVLMSGVLLPSLLTRFSGRHMGMRVVVAMPVSVGTSRVSYFDMRIATTIALPHMEQLTAHDLSGVESQDCNGEYMSGEAHGASLQQAE